MASVEQKQGATFAYVGTATLPAGTWSGECELRRGANNLAGTIQVTVTGTASPYTVRLFASGAETATWPLGSLSADIRFTDTSTPPTVIITPTFQVNVIRSVTS